MTRKWLSRPKKSINGFHAPLIVRVAIKYQYMDWVAKRFNQFGIILKLFNRIELEGCGVSPNDDSVSLAPPADPVEFLWFKMAGTGVPHIVLHVSCWTRTSRGYFRPQKSVLSKIAIFCCFWAKIGGSLTRERLVKMIFLL